MDHAGVQEPVVSRVQWWMVWAGRIISVLPVLVVLTSARWKLTHAATYVAEFNRIGWPTSALELLAFLQLTAILLFVIPQTSVLGAVLLTGYLGGAIASYVRGVSAAGAADHGTPRMARHLSAGRTTACPASLPPPVCPPVRIVVNEPGAGCRRHRVVSTMRPAGN